MRNFITGLAAIAATIVAAAPAATAQPSSRPDGNFRAEIHGGWDQVSDDAPGDDDEGRIVYGAGLSYDLDIGSRGFVGPDLSLDEGTMKECQNSILAANDLLCLRAGRDIAVGLRGGIKLGERGKLYALAAYSNARFKTDYTNPAGIVTSEGSNLDGFRLGAGYEHRLAGNVYGKVEYRDSDYENDVTRHQALLGVGLAF